jgi:hypothetical protein
LKEASRNASADRIPILVFAPVLIAGVIIQQHVVHELRHIQIFLELLVLRLTGKTVNRHQLPEPVHLSILHLEFVDDVVITLLASQVSGGEVRVHGESNFDRVTTPLFIMSNDMDDAVPWYQGIEFLQDFKQKHGWEWDTDAAHAASIRQRSRLPL